MASYQGFVLRIQSEHGSFVVEDLNASSTIADLRHRISSFLHVPPHLFRILSGYPPHPLEGSDVSTLQENRIRSGDVLRLQRLEVARPENPSHEMPAMHIVDAGGAGDYDRYVQTAVAGIMMRKVVPSNNSCLFTSVYYLLSNGDVRSQRSNDLRRVIARTVAKDKEKYNSAFLGMSNEDYCNWIEDPEHWGGAIELAILSEHFGMEIDAIDTMSLTMHRFGEANNYRNRIFLIYDGIHYDPLALEIGDGNLQTVFSVTDQLPVTLAMEVAQESRSSRQYTDLANFTLRCMDCNMQLRGDGEARAHAASFGHVNFGEINQ